MPDAPAGLAIRPGEGTTVRSPIAGDLTFLVRGEQTAGVVLAVEMVVPPGGGPPLHVHASEHELIYVLEGDLRCRVGDELGPTPPGSYVFVPPGVPHSFQNVGEEPGRLLLTFTPAGMEGFFDRMAQLAEPDPEAFRRAAATVGMEVVGPPLADSDPVRGERR